MEADKLFIISIAILIMGACSTSKESAEIQDVPPPTPTPKVDVDTLTIHDENEVDEKPQVIGGFSKLINKINSSEGIGRALEPGTVIAKFIVLKSGEGVNHEIHQSVNLLLDKEVIMALRESSFEPAIKGGQPVNTISYRSFEFKLNDSSQ